MTLQPEDSEKDTLLSQVAQGIDTPQGSAVITEDLTRTFGSFTAVNKITLEVPYGEIFGFLGPNGAGKAPPSACYAVYYLPVEDTVRWRVLMWRTKVNGSKPASAI